eukprot:14600606-Heterocapsa_arctica.AAC.1
MMPHLHQEQQRRAEGPREGHNPHPALHAGVATAHPLSVRAQGEPMPQDVENDTTVELHWAFYLLKACGQDVHIGHGQ